MSSRASHPGVDELGTILGVWAHPDDEAYLMAGTAVLAMAADQQVACVTATAGEAGESADEARWPQAELAQIRRREMSASLELLGIADHAWWELPDGGLAGVNIDRGARLVGEAIERVRPDTILTFGRDGVTGHPDHVAVGEWAVRAAARTAGRVRVLAPTKTAEWYEELPDINALIFPTGGPVTDPRDLALTVELPPEVVDRKVESLSAQASQTSGLMAVMGDADYRTWLRTEYWVERR